MSLILSNSIFRCIIKHPSPAVILITSSNTTTTNFKSTMVSNQSLYRSILSKRCVSEISAPSIFFRAFSTQSVMEKSPSGRYAGGYSNLYWKVEKSLAAAVYITLPIGIMLPHTVFDIALTILLPFHFYSVLHQIVVDYFNKTPILSFIMTLGLYMLTVANYIALVYFNYFDVGITSALHSFLTF